MRLGWSAILVALAGCGSHRDFQRPDTDTRLLYAEVGRDVVREVPTATSLARPARPVRPVRFVVPQRTPIRPGATSSTAPLPPQHGSRGRGWHPYNSITLGRNAAREATYAPDDLSKTAILWRLVEEVPGIGTAIRDTRILIAEKGTEIVHEAFGEETSISLKHGDNPYELTRARGTGLTVGLGRKIRRNEGRVDLHIPTGGTSVATLFVEYSFSFD